MGLGGAVSESGFGWFRIGTKSEDSAQQALALDVAVHDSIEVREGDLEMLTGLLLGPTLAFQVVFSFLRVHIVH